MWLPKCRRRSSTTGCIITSTLTCLPINLVFKKKDGTELQLLRPIHEVSENRDKGKAVATCFFDLSKAFDRVWHKGLLAKLQHAGVCEASLTWFTTYLTRRRQRVRANSALSQWQTIPAGVPQGSVLRPLLFLIYTIDLPPSCTNLSTTCSQLADDTALVTINQYADDAQHSLQDAVTSEATWLTDWHLLVNATKTIVMSFQRQHRQQITINDTLLQQVSFHRHLGLIIQADLRWSGHVGEKTKKARREVFQLRRIRNTVTGPCVYNLHTTNTGIWITRAFQFVPDVSRQTGEPPTACWTCLLGSSSIRAYPPQLSPPPHIITYPLLPPSIQTTSFCSRTRPWQSTPPSPEN